MKRKFYICNPSLGERVGGQSKLSHSLITDLHDGTTEATFITSLADKRDILRQLDAIRQYVNKDFL